MKYVFAHTRAHSVGLLFSVCIMAMAPHAHAQITPIPQHWGAVCKQALIAINTEIASTTRAHTLVSANMERAATRNQNIAAKALAEYDKLATKEMRIADRARQPLGMRVAINYGQHHSEVREAQGIVWNAESTYAREFKAAYTAFWDGMRTSAVQLQNATVDINNRHKQRIVTGYQQALARLNTAATKIKTACDTSPGSATTLHSANIYIDGVRRYVDTITASSITRYENEMATVRARFQSQRETRSVQLNTAIERAGNKFAATIVAAKDRGVSAITVQYTDPRLTAAHSHGFGKYWRKLVACSRCPETRDQQILRELGTALPALQHMVEYQFTPASIRNEWARNVMGRPIAAADAYNAAVSVIALAAAYASGIPRERVGETLTRLRIDEVFVGRNPMTGAPHFARPTSNTAMMTTMSANGAIRERILHELKEVFHDNPLMQRAHTPQAILGTA